MTAIRSSPAKPALTVALPLQAATALLEVIEDGTYDQIRERWFGTDE